MKRILLIQLLYFFTVFVAAEAAIKDLPRFMSLKVNEANVRTGPGTSFPIEWIFIKRNIPVEVVDAFDNWYKIRDEEGRSGWVHRSLISTRRYFVVIKDNSNLYKSPKNNLAILKLEIGVRGRIKSCRSRWCEVKVGQFQGWILKENIWGIYLYENF